MNVNNQELFNANLPQVIIEDKTDSLCNTETDTLASMYKVQSQIFELFGKCEIVETEANTINPHKQAIFAALKRFRINLGGCYAIVSIYQRFWHGCYADMEII